jgi:hypothetical protein
MLAQSLNVWSEVRWMCKALWKRSADSCGKHIESSCHSFI